MWKHPLTELVVVVEEEEEEGEEKLGPATRIQKLRACWPALQHPLTELVVVEEEEEEEEVVVVVGAAAGVAHRQEDRSWQTSAEYWRTPNSFVQWSVTCQFEGLSIFRYQLSFELTQWTNVFKPSYMATAAKMPINGTCGEEVGGGHAWTGGFSSASMTRRPASVSKTFWCQFGSLIASRSFSPASKVNRLAVCSNTICWRGGRY